MLILIAGLIAGSLDLAAAILLFVSKTKQKPAVLLKSVASAAFGPKALDGGTGMTFIGLFFHYLIALIWSAVYFVLFARLFPDTTAVVTHAIVYGLFVWVIMTRLVVPLSKAAPRPFSVVMALVDIVVLIVAIGLPFAYAAKLHPEFHFGI